MKTDELFWSRVDKSGNCWLWTGSKNENGYGIVGREKKKIRVHRYAYMLTTGTIPEGMVIDHPCYTRLCVKPEHLVAVTQKQNTENRGGSTAKSGVRGVVWHPECKKWAGYVKHNYKSYYAGVHKTIEEAAAAVVAKRNELFTHNVLDRKAS